MIIAFCDTWDGLGKETFTGTVRKIILEEKMVLDVVPGWAPLACVRPALFTIIGLSSSASSIKGMLKKVCPESGRRATSGVLWLRPDMVALLSPSGSQTCRSSRRSRSRTKRTLRTSKGLRPFLRFCSGRTNPWERLRTGFLNIPSH